MVIIKQFICDQGVQQTARTEYDRRLPNALIDQLSSGRRPYTPPMLTVLDATQIGTGGTSSLAEASNGVFGLGS